MQVQSLDSEANREAALVLAEAEFGGLDLGRSSVREELSAVMWDRSLGVVDGGGKCHGFILAAPLEMTGYAATRPGMSGFPAEEVRDIRGIRGDALVVRPEAGPLGSAMVRRFLSSTCSGYDYVWGTAHVDLGNARFWSRHAVILARGDDGEIVFAVPLNTQAKAALADAARSAGIGEEAASAPRR